ncbi:hypothetical protein EW026_g5997 [Hermanssonia centrifuga]|uniref:Uncharacterized protein n=1 Tax=Hermanssonia centrifuga TaxID=98765 RepID=A0A4S4KCD1_9APHY|nr:hypothetical protein EW026_g5997 [Hermanssonia centrifuga]
MIIPTDNGRRAPVIANAFLDYEVGEISPFIDASLVIFAGSREVRGTSPFIAHMLTIP